MELKLQTKVTDQNRQEFIKNVYPHLSQSRDQLIQLNLYNVSSFILADCCGWYYKTFWPELTISSIETLYSLKEYQLDRSKFQGIIDNRDYSNIKWPTLNVDNCALIFDRSVVLKYRTVDDIINVISTASKKYQPEYIVFNSSTLFIDDSRVKDRLSSLSLLTIPGYIVTEFFYNTVTIKITFKKICCV